MKSPNFPAIVASALILAGGCSTPQANSRKETYSSFDLPSEHSAKGNASQFTCSFEGASLTEVFKTYEQLSGRTVVAGQFPDVRVNLRIATPVSRIEGLQMLDNVLAQNRVTMVLAGDKAVKAVPTDKAQSESPPEIGLPWRLLPESSSFMSRTVRLQHLKPSETVPFLMVHSKLPNSIVAMDAEQLLLLRDYSANIRQQLKLLQELEQKRSGK